MMSRYTTFAVVVALACSLASWTGLARRAMGGQGSGGSWHTWGSGYSGGGWASGGGGGHK
jgi:uncharacterized membrane protein YgcG